MRVTLFAVGTQGDVRPIVALGCGLVKAGHHVRIATSENFRELVISAGLEWAGLTADFRKRMAAEPETMIRGLNPFVIARSARRNLKEMASFWVDEGLAACRDADLLIGTGTASRLATSLAEALGKPCVPAQLMPMTPAREIPPVVLTPPNRPLPGRINMVLYHVLAVLAWAVLAPAINTVVRRKLGLRPYPWYEQLDGPKPLGGRLIYGYSSHVVPRPHYWPPDIRVVGYWFLDKAQDWQPPTVLAHFLDSSPKPVYVGFGSVPSHDAAKITAQIVQAIRMSGQRAILATGWGGLADIVSPSDAQFLVIDETPHDWLFPKVALAVHHGGAGTTAAAVRAGIPSVVVPFVNDQPFWAWQLGQLGVAPPYLTIKTLTSEKLAATIGEALSETMRQRARALGERIRAEDGVTAAIQAMTDWGVLSGTRSTNDRQPVSTAPTPLPPRTA